ncbi:efflux RND transporter periplasmic adaptor subunit [Leptospira vanthielii]|uniref:HlyD family secretion protein n=1 Tax=Leptospira vanthielii serovar Holland str. Waz Holland = ATCC 700522 TaxID=1218591 RepID=N1W3W6_9LEPT|nr:biotin/lipoyl-binding protein [Leptospira vanthielii]EMY68150.1 HlyD family secretion protein [Leptospira vanthielii serovar Holland str. Waz Holland = ATCC 700522]
MKSNQMTKIRILVRKLLVMGVGYILFSVLYTLLSTVDIRNRFPFLVGFFYFPNYWETINEVSAMESPNQDLVFQRPRLLEENKVIEFPAVVEPTKEIQLHNKQSGRVRKIYVDEGSFVKEGQVLLEIDDELIRLEGERLSLSLNVSESQATIAFEKWKQAEKQVDVKLREVDKKTELVELAEKEWILSKDLKEKKIILWKQGFVSLTEVEKLKQEEQSKETQYKNLIRDRENLLSGINLDLELEDLSFEGKLKVWREKNTSLEKSEYELSKSHLKIIKNQIKSNEQLLSETRLRAPKSGKILKIQIKEGELTTQSPVMILMEKGELSAGFQIGESDLLYVSLGKEVLFVPSQENLPAIKGKLDRVGGFLDPRSHSIGIKVRLEPKQTNILPGMFGLVQVKLLETIEKILIPSSSLHGDENSGFYVNVKQKEGTTKKFIQFKPYLLNELEILSGLSLEDEVETSLSL